MLQLAFTECSLSEVVCRLLLVVSLWDGPVLWGHNHTFAAAELEAHFARFHYGVADPATLGWHWHCSFPGSDDRDKSGRSTPCRSHREVILAVAVNPALTAGVPVAAAAIADDWLAATDAGRQGCAGRGEGKAASWTNSPLQMLCRLRC